MTVVDEDTAAPSQAEWAIRPELPIDLDQIHALHRAAFVGAAEAELVDAIRASAELVADLSLVAVTADGSVLGHVLASRIGFVPDDATPATPTDGVLALAPIAVLPAHQGRGIGSALMRALLVAADERPEPFVAVVGAPSFYGRFGFFPGAEANIRSPYDDAGDACQVRPTAGRAVPAGTVTYPPAFSAV